MSKHFKTITEANVKGKRVLVRSCFDVPVKNGQVTDDTRIKSAVPTIKWLSDSGAAVIIVSKMGRPGGKKIKELSLFQVVGPLAKFLGKPVRFVSESIGKEVEAVVSAVRPGDILILENLRFHPEEEANNSDFAKKLASYADLFVLDDFPNVQNDHAGVTGITKYLPSYAGIDLSQEVKKLAKVFKKPKKPFVAVVGGAKISTKIDILKALTRKVDVLILGGGMANTFLAAEGYDVGKSLFEPDFLDSADEVKREAEDAGVELLLPDDAVVVKNISESAVTESKPIDEVEKSDIIVDIGPKSVAKFSEPLKFAGTVFWNGPVGMAEHKNFAGGTTAIADIISNSSAKSIIGGGDTISAVGDEYKFDFISTGGGATLAFVAGEKLPGLEALGK